MHQLLFEDIPLQLSLSFILCLTGSDTLLFALQNTFALQSTKIHSMYAKVSRLQWCLKGSRIRNKWKLIICFERLTSSKHRIGFRIARIVLILTMSPFAVVIYLLNSLVINF